MRIFAFIKEVIYIKSLKKSLLLLCPIQLQYSIIMIKSAIAKTLKLIFNQSIQLFSVRVRYAPSPTGFMHVGGLRTALFNYLFARKNKGKFILRIEDTDKNREVEGSLQNIFDTLQWIGAVPDESIKKEGEFGPYIQSERLHVYKAVQKQLLKNNMAYPCFCKLDHKKDHQQSQIHAYNGKCRKLTFQQIKSRILAKQPYAVRIKSDLVASPKHFRDQVFGEIQFKQLDDFVIVRSNGWPTFHLANVVDDWKMGITHVMRGEEWLSNTNKHIYLYRLLGAQVPKFVHLPLIKDMAGKKLAKRDPTSSAKNLQTGKYQIQAVKCFLAQMGLNRVLQKPEVQKKEQPQQLVQKAKNSKEKVKQNAKGKEKRQQQNLKLLTQSQMIDQFDISRVTKIPVKFDVKQLDYLNRLSLKKRWKVAQQIQSQMQYFVSKTHQLIPSSTNFPKQYTIRFLASIVQRFNFITDLSLYSYYFEHPQYTLEKSQEDIQKIFGKEAKLEEINTSQGIQYKLHSYDPALYERGKKIIHNIRMLFEHVIEPNAYCELQIVKKLSEFLYQSPELKNEDVYHMLRFIVSGRKSGPNISLACEIIGRQVILKRIASFSNL